MPDIEDILRSIDKKASGAFVNVEYDEIDVTYRISGNGTGQVDTVTYSFKGTPVMDAVATYDVSDRFIKLIISRIA